MAKKTKLEILASLLQRDKITIEEFITLMEKEVQYVYQPYYNYPAFNYTGNNPYIHGTDTITLNSGALCTISTTGTTGYSHPNTCTCEANYNFCTCNSLS